MYAQTQLRKADNGLWLNNKVLLTLTPYEDHIPPFSQVSCRKKIKEM